MHSLFFSGEKIKTVIAIPKNRRTHCHNILNKASKFNRPSAHGFVVRRDSPEAQMGGDIAIAKNGNHITIDA